MEWYKLGKVCPRIYGGHMSTFPSVQSSFVSEVRVRLVESEAVAQWQELMALHHYLGFPGFVDDGAASGWPSSDGRRRRLKFVANNARFLILPDAHYPNLGSRVLALATQC